MNARAQRGITYITALFVLAIMAGGLALAGEVWDTSARREREAELLHVGNEYRKAIERYYLSGTQRQYPQQPLRPAEGSAPARHRAPPAPAVPDPITGKEEWGLVKSADGGFAGVYSLSEARAAQVRRVRGARRGVRGQDQVLRLAVRLRAASRRCLARAHGAQAGRGRRTEAGGAADSR